MPINNETGEEKMSKDDIRCMHVKTCAVTAHEVNRAYCLGLGDTSQAPWDEAPQWQRDSAIAGVEFTIANPDAGDAASHESWLKEKREAGWKHGAVKDAEAKTHPCFVPFRQLPLEQQAKDALFRTTVLGVAASLDLHVRSAD